MTEPSGITVGLDLGHGEDTWENTGGKGVKLTEELGGGRMEEHWFNAAVGIYTKELLENSGLKVYMAQKPYAKDVPLQTRTNLYASNKVDFIMSIHANAGVATANGFCAFYWETNSKAKRLAELYIKHAKAILGKDMNVFGTGVIASKLNFWTNFHMTRVPKVPSILTESGFMTNKNDIQDLLSDKFRRQMAEVHARAACEFAGVTFKPIQEEPVQVSKPVTPSQPVPAKGETYTIKAGDTLWKIANIEGVEIEDILSLNPHIDPSKLQIGQKVVIPSEKIQKPVQVKQEVVVSKPEVTKTVVTLPATTKGIKNTSWALYHLNRPPTRTPKSNIKLELNPHRHGGLTYDVLGYHPDNKNVVKIKSKDKGEGWIYVGKETGAVIKKVNDPKPKKEPSDLTKGIQTVGRIKIVGVKSAAILMDKPDRLSARNMGELSLGTSVPISGSVKGYNNPNGYWEVVIRGKKLYISGQFGKLI